MAYDPSRLSPMNPEDEGWALATLRFILKDTGEPERYSDTELLASLELHQFACKDRESKDRVFYRPHATAAALVRSDATRAIERSVDNASEVLRDPHAAAASIARSGQPVDDWIERESGRRPTTGRTFRTVF